MDHCGSLLVVVSNIINMTPRDVAGTKYLAEAGYGCMSIVYDNRSQRPNNAKRSIPGWGP